VAIIERINLAPEFPFLGRVGAPIFRPPVENSLVALAPQLLLTPLLLRRCLLAGVYVTSPPPAPCARRGRGLLGDELGPVLSVLRVHHTVAGRDARGV
jgi:hypothetical protein